VTSIEIFEKLKTREMMAS